MNTRIIDEEHLDPQLDAEIKKGLCRCFPPDVGIFSQTRKWHGTGPAWTVILMDNDAVAAHVGIVDRVIRAGRQEIRVAGIQNVFVLPEYRGRGLGTVIMDAAMAEAVKCHYECGFLFCVPELEKVYAQCGWQLIAKEKILRTDETGQEVSLPEKNIAMFYPISLRAFPQGIIHLQGNDW